MGNETELIKERLDLAEVVGEYVPLKRVGAHFKGLCPFHQEKTPSFIVSPQKGIWHCFGCSRGGDLFSFIQEIEKLDFPEALKLLAERTGVKLERSGLRQGFGEARQGKQAQDKRQRLFDLLSMAAKFYHAVLMKHEEGKRAREYLAERGVTEATMREFETGYAPMRWDSVQQFLQGKGFTGPEMIEAGLVGQGQGGKMYDRFRGRVMFPIQDVQGRVVAFGGRIVPWHATGEEGKYVNSPETGLYEKRRTVYNLSRAKGALRHAEACIVVEGYMDVVMLHQAGVENVVASSGTAFTAEQIMLLKRHTSTLHFAFDADAAGSKATVAATEAALAAGMHVATIVLPAGEDPADVALKRSGEVHTIFSQPKSLISVLLERLKSEGGTAVREATLSAVLPLMRRVANPIQQGEMVRELAAALAIPEAKVVQILGRGSVPTLRLASTPGEEVSSTPGEVAGPVAERALLGILLVSPAARQAVWGKLMPDFFLEKDTRDLYNTMHSLTGEEWLTQLPQSQQSLGHALVAMAQERMSASGEGVIVEGQALLKFLFKRYLEMQLKDMQTRLREKTGSDRVQALKEFQAVAEKLSAFDAA